MALRGELKRIKQRIEGNLPPRSLQLLRSEVALPSPTETVLQVGRAAPGFALRDQSGQVVESTKVLARGPLVLSFFRGFWCPYCNAELQHLEQHAAQIRELGASLYAVSPQLPEYSRKLIATRALSFDILHDQSNELANQFGLKYALSSEVREVYESSLGVNLTLYHGDDAWELPMPARFLIDSDGAVRFAEASSDTTDRPEWDGLVASIVACRSAAST